jgi:hypothetical protein
MGGPVPRRYLRASTSLLERTDTPLLEFPEGEGPPLFLSSSFAHWTSLAPGQGQRLVLDRARGGVYASGLVGSTCALWVLLSGDTRAAYCFHAVGSELDPRAHTDALRILGGVNASEVYVVLAARHTIERRHEQFFSLRGVRHDRIFTYSNALLPQFGMSARGCVGEAR